MMPDINLIREYVISHISEKRYLHTSGVEETAVLLCSKYGGDEKKVRIAALLHDITKEFDYERQLQIVEEFGIILDEVEKNEPKLLHSITASALAKNEFNIDDEDILNAIRYHTTARKNMTVIEKVIYLADYIEPNRDFDGVKELRKIILKDINEGMVSSLIFSVCEVANKRRMVHPNSLYALNEHIKILRSMKK